MDNQAAQIDLLSSIEKKLGELPDPNSDKPLPIETLILNLNTLIGYFMAKECPKAMNTVWRAEQAIKNQT